MTGQDFNYEKAILNLTEKEKIFMKWLEKDNDLDQAIRDQHSWSPIDEYFEDIIDDYLFVEGDYISNEYVEVSNDLKDYVEVEIEEE